MPDAFSRTIKSHYRDPADEIWIACARAMGLRIERTDNAYATTNGDGTLQLAAADLDPDDCTAQMVFHELCHALVQGPGSFELADWGLDNTSDRDVVNEHACLRVQAVLASRHGLRDVLASTTDHREFYETLGDAPLEPRTEPSVALAIKALAQVDQEPWAPHLDSALAATARIAEAARPFAHEDSLWAASHSAPKPHPSGLSVPHRDTQVHCGDCAWSYRGGPGQAVLRCRQADGARVAADAIACERFEQSFDCLDCGACCREAYHSVTIGKRDPFVKRHPELVEFRGDYVEVRRRGDRCTCLSGGSEKGGFVPYTCTIYNERPKPCRDMENAGRHCITARRRVHLTQ